MAETRLPLISIHSHKGGVGKTTVAALMGLALTENPKRKVCLVDLDLVAPGLAPMLGMRPPKLRILDYLLGAPKRKRLPPKANEICRPVRGPYGDSRKLSLIAGGAEHDPARGVQSYILADLRAGVVRARVELLLRTLKKKQGIDIFVLDTPPSLFGMSETTRRLVERHRGAEVFAVTPTVPDLNGLSAMLLTIDELRSKIKEKAAKKGERPAVPVAQAVVANRYRGDIAIADAKDRVLDLFVQSAGAERLPRGQQRALKGWLAQYSVARVPDAEPIERMAALLAANEDRPTAADLLRENGELRELGEKLYDKVIADKTP